MTLPSRVSFVTLGVADVEQAAAFYERLGWKRSSGSVRGEIAFFPLGGLVLGIWSYRSLGGEAGLPVGPVPPFRGVSLSVNVASETEVDRVLAFAAGAGGKPLRPGTKADWGGYSGYFADPDGNAWEIAYNPGFPLDENGIPQLPE